MATFYIQLKEKLLKISGDLTHDNIVKALGYTPSNFSGNFNDLNDNPFTQNEDGKFNITDEQGNIIATVDEEGIHSVNFIAGEHVLSNKADKSDLEGLATESYVITKVSEAKLEGSDITIPVQDVKVNGQTVIKDMIAEIDLTSYAKTEDIPSLDGYVQSSELPNFNEFAKTSDIPSTDGLATESYVITKVSESAETFKNYIQNELDEFETHINETDEVVSASLNELNEKINEIEEYLGDSDELIATSLTDLNEKINNLNINVDLSDYYTKEEIESNNKNFITNVKINGSTKSPSNGIVDLGTVITSHQDISGKQDTLISGTNIKTINGQSILGSGNITIESGSSDANVQAVDEISTIIDVDLDKYIVETTDDNIILDNNKYYKKTNVSSSISITLNIPEDNTVFTSFSIEFTTSSSGTSVSLPDTIKWLGGELPTFENDFTYQISICNGLGVCAKYA